MRRISSIAAATAFWFFLSIVPMVILAVSVLPYTALRREQLLLFLSPVLPSSLQELISSILEDIYRGGFAVMSVSAAAAVWSAARGFASLLRGLEEIFRRRTRSGFFLRRVRGIVCTLGLLLFIYAAVVFGSFSRQILRLTEVYAPSVHDIIICLTRLRSLAVVAALTLLFMGLYRWGAGTPLPPRETFPGAALGAAGWSLLTRVFSAWVDMGGYGTYGSLATVVVVMLWLYYCQYALLLGACLNQMLPRLKNGA